MTRLHRPHFSTIRPKNLRVSKRLLFGLPAGLLLLAGPGVGIYVRHSLTVASQAADVSRTSTVAKANTTQSEAQKATPATAPDSSSGSTPPPMNRPGNRYVDESSAGPEKLTYRENRSLIISPSTVTVSVSSGVPMASSGPQTFQVNSDDGQPVGFPQAANAGGVFFGVRSDGGTAGPADTASWAMAPDPSHATPGTYITTFTAWSSDRQVRYTGSFQLVVQP